MSNKRPRGDPGSHAKKPRHISPPLQRGVSQPGPSHFHAQCGVVHNTESSSQPRGFVTDHDIGELPRVAASGSYRSVRKRLGTPAQQHHTAQNRKRKFSEAEPASVESPRKVRKVSGSPRLSSQSDSHPFPSRGPRKRKSSGRDDHKEILQKLHFSDPYKLYDIAQMPPDDQLSTICRRQKEFQEFLGSLQDDPESDADHQYKVSLIVKILSKLLAFQENEMNIGGDPDEKQCRKTFEFDANKLNKVVLSELTGANGRVFLHTLNDIFLQMPMQSSPAKRGPFLDFLEDIYQLFKQLLGEREAYFSQTLPIDALCGTSRQLANQDVRYGGIQVKSELLLEQRDLARTMYYESTIDLNPNVDEDYTVLPSPEELHQGSLPLDLPLNITEGAYRDTEHYLTTQYRLLREDFIHPLRCALHELRLDDVAEEDPHAVRLYKSVQFNQGTTYIPGEGTAFRVSFELPAKRVVRWERSKCLTYGSLLCLSSDGFQTVIFATVVGRKPEDLRCGIVTIRLENAIDGLEVSPSRVFKMVDSPGFYAAYAPVLKHLKKLQNNESLLPFVQYFVHCSTDVKQPAYLWDEGFTWFNLSGIVCSCNENEDIQECQHQWVDLSDSDTWLQLDMTSTLDDSQKASLYAALTKELAIIQGPPGTGKTYIGLKIVEALLRNSHCYGQNGPIVVVCYTNHALDQFLEGLLGIKQDQVYRRLEIRRVGGRCKSERVEACNIRSYVIRECRKLKIYGCSPHQVHKLRARIQAIKELTTGEYIPYNFKLYCSLLGDQTVDELHWFCQFSGFNTLARDDRLAGWLNQDFQQNINDWYNNGHEDEMPEFSHHNAIEDDRQVITTEEEDNEDSILHKALKREAVKKFVARFKSVEPLTRMTMVQLCKQRALDKIEKHVRLQMFKLLLTDLKEELEKSLKKKEAKQKVYNEHKQMVMIRCLQEADVVGLTTTGAAKHNNILSQINAKTVIIEEAAEVLEAHTITTLTRHSQHLILIGDHKQLRPKTNDYSLARKHHLDISLFERLVRNQFPCVTLKVQHRMRPDISELVSTRFYQGKLLNHDRTKDYPVIAGIKHSLFFITHNELESFEDQMSPSNEHEAAFLARLCNYLLQQGYKPGQVTVITPYTGQMFTLRGKLTSMGISDVRITTIDNYQGEENDVVLLSLVRSNESNITGFVKDPHRICVALSRAKQGFYCIGNFSLLSKASPVMWGPLVQDLSAKKIIGKSLQLECSRHGTITEVVFAADFDKAKDGGCGKKCRSRLSKCRHVCPRFCHPNEDVHDLQCKEPCPKRCPRGHRCQLLCYQECADCEVLVEQKLPECGHKQNVPCSVSPSAFICQVECKKQLACGHQCKEKCGEACTVECQVLVKRKRKCGHEVQADCYLTDEKFSNLQKCKIACGTELECGHVCKGTCGGCHQGRLHMRCKEKCERSLLCGHTCSDNCAQNCPPCSKPCKLACVHGLCGHECFTNCQPCSHMCAWKCDHYECTRNCGEVCDRPRCNMPCPNDLPCGHPCVSVCGEDCPIDFSTMEPLCKLCDREKWDELTPIIFGTEEEEGARFIQLAECGHIFEVTALDQWMDGEPDGDQVEIKWKTCCICNTPVRKTHRYSNINKNITEDMNKIKHSKNTRLSKEERKRYEQELKSLADAQERIFFSRGQLHHYRRSISVKLDVHVMHDLIILSAARDARDAIKVIRRSNVAGSAFLCTQIEEQFIPFLKRNLHKMTNQVQLDVLAEKRRIMVLARAYSIVASTATVTVAPSDHDFLTDIITKYETTGQKIEKITDEAAYQSLRTQLQDCANRYCIALTQEERTMIIKAMNAKPGSWYKCPKGHYYQIGECGGAMEESECPECGARIGGQRHRLLDNNAHAGEFDRSTHAAWSAGANLADYDPQQLRELQQ